MAIFSFFKRPLHQKFDYKPRFYDQGKEELEARLAAHSAEKSSTDQVKSRISSGLRRKSRVNSTQIQRRSNLRLVAILVLLVWMTYYFLQKYLPAIIQAVE